jgi:amino acid transporter
LALIGWLLSCAGALLVALVFAKLAQLVPQTGGPYAYTRVGFGDFAGYLIAWGYWIGIWSSITAVAVALVSYASGCAGWRGAAGSYKAASSRKRTAIVIGVAN